MGWLGFLAPRLIANSKQLSETMNLTQKIFAGVGVAALATTAVFPYAKSYVDSLPKKMTKQEAAQRYMALTCPSNKIADYITSLEKKWDKEASVKYYVGSPELAAANSRVGALETRINIATKNFYAAEEKRAKELLNPKYIWPNSVQEDVKKSAQRSFLEAGRYHQGDFETMTEEEKKEYLKEANQFVTLSSNIRQELGLPPRGKGCEKK